jgi:hypothetical protein
MRTNEYKIFYDKTIKLLRKLQENSPETIIYTHQMPKNWNSFLVTLLGVFDEINVYEAMSEIFDMELLDSADFCDYKGKGFILQNNTIFVIHPDIYKEQINFIKSLNFNNIKIGLITPNQFKKVNVIEKTINHPLKIKNDFFVEIHNFIKKGSYKISVYSMKKQILIISENNKKKEKKNININTNLIKISELEEIIDKVIEGFKEKYNINVSKNETSINLEIKPRKTLLIDIDDLGFDELSYKEIHKFIKDSNNLLIISGKEKSGKTTTINSILDNIIENNPEEIIQYFSHKNEYLNDYIIHNQDINSLKNDSSITGDVFVLDDISNQESFTIVENLLSKGKKVIISMYSENTFDTINILKNKYSNINYNFIISKLTGIYHQDLIPTINLSCIEEIEFIHHDLYSILMKLNNKPSNKEIIYKEEINNKVTPLKLVSEFFKNDNLLYESLIKEFNPERLIQEKRNSDWDDMLEHAMIGVRNKELSLEEVQRNIKLL